MRQNVPVLGDFMYFVYISSANSFSALVIGERERKKRERKKEEKKKRRDSPVVLLGDNQQP